MQHDVIVTREAVSSSKGRVTFPHAGPGCAARISLLPPSVFQLLLGEGIGRYRRRDASLIGSLVDLTQRLADPPQRGVQLRLSPAELFKTHDRDGAARVDEILRRIEDPGRVEVFGYLLLCQLVVCRSSDDPTAKLRHSLAA